MERHERPQRRSTWDAPTRAQRRYGNVLPPSLRWGARRRAPDQEDADDRRRATRTDTFPTRSHSAPRRDGRPVRRRHSSERRGSRDRQSRHRPDRLLREGGEPYQDRRRADSQHVATTTYAGLEEDSGALIIRPLSRRRESSREESEASPRRAREPAVAIRENNRNREESRHRYSNASNFSEWSDSVPIWLPPSRSEKDARVLYAHDLKTEHESGRHGSEDCKVRIEKYCVHSSNYLREDLVEEHAVSQENPDVKLTLSPLVDGAKLYGSLQWM